MIAAMSDWWRLRKYKIDYFDIPGGNWLPDEEPCPCQYGPVFVAMHRMAHQINGRAESLDEANRIIEWLGTFPWRHDVCREQILRKGTSFWPEKLNGYEYDPSRRKYLHFNWENHGAIWLAAASVAWLMENVDGPLRRVLQHAMGNYFRWMSSVLTDDLLFPYWSQTDLETGKTYSLVRPRASTDRKDRLIDFDWNFLTYASKIAWGDPAARLADLGVLAHQLAPGFSPGALSLSKTMLSKLDDQRLKWFIDPDGQQLMPEDAWLAYVMSSEAPAFTSLTYWRARAWGINLEGE
jgi:hypothetical protein